MSDNSAVEKYSYKYLKNTDFIDVKKSLNNYLNQLKFHFNLSDADLLKILEFTLKSRKVKKTSKKWWVLRTVQDYLSFLKNKD